MPPQVPEVPPNNSEENSESVTQKDVVTESTDVQKEEASQERLPRVDSLKNTESGSDLNKDASVQPQTETSDGAPGGAEPGKEPAGAASDGVKDLQTTASEQLRGLKIGDVEESAVTSDQAPAEQERDATVSSLKEPDNEIKSEQKGKANTTDTKEEWDEKQEPPEPDALAPQFGGDAEFGTKAPETSENEPKPEIDNIMKQFKDGEEPPSDQTSSPGRSTLPAFQRPPRISSLQNLSQPEVIPPSPTPIASGSRLDQVTSPTGQEAAMSSPVLSKTPSLVSQPPLPEPDPEPDLPFDFHRFLEQLRHRTADPVARFLRSFLNEFGKRQWMVHEQVKIINDFLAFIGNRMAQCEVWRQVSDAEFDNAKEGMEKLVMNRLYAQTFSPEIPPPELSRSKRKPPSNPQAPGRRGQHQEDVERDEVLAQKVRIYGWLREEHLDIQPLNDKGRKFLRLAQQELLKIRSYRAPRDKVICVLNCCKVLFGYLRNSNTDQSADAFIPLLIFTVLKANPDHLVSNVQYILRFRNQDKLAGESGYYMSSLLGAVQFIENLDRTQLTVSDEEFEKNVEQAVSSIAERHSLEEKRASPKIPAGIPINEKSTPSRPEVTPRNSLDAVSSSPRKTVSRTTSTTPSGPSTEEQPEDDNAAVAGLLRTIQKPLTTIGRIFADDGPAATPQPGSTPRASPRPPGGPNPAQTRGLSPAPPSNLPPGALAENQRQRLAAEDAAARQASAETAEAHRRQTAEHQTVVETLQGMFPDLDREVISDVVRMKEGRVGLAVDACLALSH